jgi:hypothetical protein
MSIFFPIFGAGTEPPFIHVLAVLSALDAKGPDVEGAELSAFHVRGARADTLRASVTVSHGQSAAVLSGLDTGAGQSGKAVSSADILGERVTPVRAGLETRGESAPAVFLSGLDINREAPGLFLAGFEVIGRNARAVIAGLDARRTALLNVQAGLEIVLPREAAMLASLEVGLPTEGAVLTGLDVSTAQGLDVLVDIVSAVVASGRAGTLINLTARMKVNGNVTPFESFAFNAPPDVLGARLDVIMAREDLEQIAADASIDFEIGVTATGQTQFVALVKNGRLAGRTLNLSADDTAAPNDRLAVSIVNVLADRWQLAPRAPFIMYDPARVPEKDVKPDSRNAVLTEAGGAIVTALVPFGGLSMRAVLEAAYVKGCGFQKVITNIPDFPVKVANFDLTGTFHGTAQAFLGIFDPIYFADDGNHLFIIDTERPLPAGFTPRALPLGAVIDPAWTLPAKNFINALVLTYPADPDGDTITFFETIEQDPQMTTGNFGADDYSETDVSRRVRKYYDMLEPAVILSETVVEEKTEIHSMVEGQLELTFRDTQRDNYDSRGLKSGHLRTIEASVLTPEDGERKLKTVETEINTTAWMVDPNEPSQSLMLWSETRTSGLVLVEAEAAPDGTDIRTPILKAQENKIIDKDSTTQTTEDAPIRTVRESLVPKGGATASGGAQQWEIKTVEIDHLTGTTIPRRTQPRAGSNVTGNQSARNRSILLRNSTSEALYGNRQPASLSSGEVPREIALEQARLYLNKLAHGRLEWSTDLPGVDMAARRGSIFRPNDRDGLTGTFIVTGLTVTGKPVGDGAFDVSMALQGRELKA